MVAHNDTSHLVEATSSSRYGHIAPKLLAKAIVIKETLSWVKDMFTQPVMIETDCLSVVQEIIAPLSIFPILVGW